jgi:hypothetical protein
VTVISLTYSQQAGAEIGAMITTTMGTLSCLTAGWWGKVNDLKWDI